MKSRSTILIGVTLSFLSFSFIKSGVDFSGDWEVETEKSTFTLYLKQVNNKITGNHCSVMQKGGRIDCVLDKTDVSIFGNVEHQSYVIVRFESQYCKKFGTAKITKLDANTIDWQIISRPKGEYYIPDHIVLKKVKSL
ncbi:MAG: hypothetical protein LW852_02825 [Sediminibacterium sp.]|jgi:hypothetical protein|nr:hypothetical protein [Sediminibacterium sp.]